MDIKPTGQVKKIRSDIIKNLENLSSKGFIIQMIAATIVTYIAALTVIVLIDLILYETTIGGTNLLGFFGYFLASSLSMFIPISIVSTVVVLAVTMPIIRIMRRHEKGETITDEEYFKARTRSARLPVIIFIVNIIHPIILSLSGGVFSGSPAAGLVTMVKDISIFILAALAQNSLYQRLLSRPRAIMKIHTVDTNARNWFVKNIERIQLYSSVLLIAAVLFHSSMTILKEMLPASPSETKTSISAIADQRSAGNDSFQKMRAKMQDTLGKTTQQTKKAAGDIENTDINYGIVFVLIILIVIGSIKGVDTIVRRAQKTQTKILQDVLGKLAEGSGDLTQRVLIVQADETGLLSHQLNKLLDRLQTMFRNIRTQASQVAETSQAISLVLEGTVAATEEMAASVNQINYNADRNSQIVATSQNSLEKMLSSLDQINSNVNTQAAYVEQTSSAMTEMIANIQSVNEVTSKANDVSESLSKVSEDGSLAVLNSITAVKDIEESSIEVNNLVITISKILAQTNMLAMNAAIEAAHAGDAGRGFAVVAEEVRNLADDSSTNLKTISANMRDVLDRVNRGVNLSETAGEALKEVGDKTNQTTRLMSEVASAMQEQAAGANEVLNSIHSLVEASNSINKLSEDQQQTNQVMKENLERTVNAFTEVQSATSELSLGNSEILNGIEELKQVIMKNEEVVASLQKELGGYKI